MSSVASPQLAGGPTQPLSASCLYPQGEARAHCDINSQSTLGFGNLPASIHATGSYNHGPAMSDVNQLMTSGGSSGAGRRTSSLLTDADSAVSGGDSLRRSANINADSYMLLPASPLSFSSGNISLSGFPTMEGSSIVPQIGTSFSRVVTHQDQNSQEMQQQGASSATSHTLLQQPSQQQSLSHTGQIFLESSGQGDQPTSYTDQQAIQQLSDEAIMNLSLETRKMLVQHNQMKKRRLDVRQDDLLQQHVMEQLRQGSGPGVASQLQWQDSFQRQFVSPQVPLMLQQQRLLQMRQLQLLQQPASPMQQKQIQQQQICQQLQQNMPQYSINCSYGFGACARRLTQFIMTQRHRPADNSILFWRKLVAEYFAPRTKKRWCMSSYNSVGCNGTAVSSLEPWQCEICGSKSGRGFEVSVQALPALNKIKFDSGVIDELLFLETPQEQILPSGIMLLESKAVQESVYENLRVVHEGQIRVSFGPDMKIFSWGFCCRRRHEEFLPSILVKPQVKQLVQVVQKYQASVSESGSSELSAKDLQSNCDMFVQAVHQLRVLDKQAVDDFGFPKGYTRGLKIAEVVDSMKDLMDFSRERNIGPIESLEIYPRLDADGGLEAKKVEGMHQTVNQGSGVLTGSTEAVARLAGYLNLQRQNSIMAKANAVSQDASGSKQVASQFQGPISPVPISLQNQASSQSSLSQGFVTSMPVSLQNVPLQAPAPQSLLDPRLLRTMYSQSSHLKQQYQQNTPQQVQDVLNSNRVSSGQSVGGQTTNLHSVGNPLQGARVSGYLVSRPAVGNVVESSNSNLVNHVNGMTPRRNDSFKDDANSTMIIGGRNAVNLRSDASQDLPLPELVQDISHEISESGIFSGEPTDMDYGWKA